MPKPERYQTTLAVQINRYRSALGWTQEELANASGLHRTYIGHVERGEINVALKNIVLIADALDVTPADLLTPVE